MTAYDSQLSPLLVVALVTACLTSPAFGNESLTEQVCHRDWAEMLSGIEAARADGVRQIDQAIAESTSQEERAELVAQRDELWDREEQERVFADVTLRDCLRYVREQRAARQ